MYCLDAFLCTPSLHNKIPAWKTFARGWVAQKTFLFIGIGVRLSMGWVRKKRESSNGDRVYAQSTY